jgi:hypothetical protein
MMKQPLPSKQLQSARTSQALAPGITLHVNKMALSNTDDHAHTLYTYTLQNDQVSTVELTLDFSQATNVSIEGNPEQVFTVGP